MGPCVCGDPYCASCGDPSLARYKALCEAMMDLAIPVFPVPQPRNPWIDYEGLLGWIVERLLDPKAKGFVAALYEEFVRQDQEEETDNALRYWGKT